MKTTHPVIPVHQTITGGTIRLVPLEVEHHNSLASILSDDRVWLGGFGNGLKYKPANTAGLHHFITKVMDEPERLNYAILTAAGDFAGTTSIGYFYPETGQCMIGRTVLDPAWWGKAINSASKELLINLAFTHGWRRIISHVAPTNANSMKALERSGFIKEQEIENYETLADGTIRGMVIYALHNPAYYTNPAADSVVLL